MENSPDTIEKYTRIRIEKIEYQEKKATAVYFEDFSKHVKIMRLEREVQKKQAEARNLESYTSMMSHEFRTPLATAIMFIKMILERI